MFPSTHGNLTSRLLFGPSLFCVKMSKLLFQAKPTYVRDVKTGKEYRESYVGVEWNYSVDKWQAKLVLPSDFGHLGTGKVPFVRLPETRHENDRECAVKMDLWAIAHIGPQFCRKTVPTADAAHFYELRCYQDPRVIEKMGAFLPAAAAFY